MESGDSPFFDDFVERVASLGGFMNAHLHLDRAGTYGSAKKSLTSEGVHGGEYLTLGEKHGVIPRIHASREFEPARFQERMEFYINKLVEFGATRADTFVDVTPGSLQDRGFWMLHEMKEKWADRLDLRLGAYNPLGFRTGENQGWNLLSSVGQAADYFGLLPERDEKSRYPDHIGFEESCRKAIELAQEFQKELHVHIDQANHSFELDTERFIDLLERQGYEPSPGVPSIWLVHVISPSTYSEERFSRLVERLCSMNLGVITCPSAAISMRQYRPLVSPTSNSIARVLEFLAAGIPVRVGSDNICDITMPLGTCDLVKEIFVLANALRFYEIDILASISSGGVLNREQIERVQTHLREDELVVSQVASEVLEVNS